MHPVEIIIKKRDKGELSKEEIDFFISSFTRGEIPDYQASAWAMAVLLNGMTVRETTDLTLAMVATGEILDLSEAVTIAVDKHSTGGVGDKTTLVVQPIVAACGLPVGKMSGRGLGFSGGTLDKMESIPGFRVDFSTQEFLKQLSKHGMVLSGQTTSLAPADGKLYALRDVTGTVRSIPLIASSIMSKKIAAGAQAVVLDVKTGLGAFTETLEEAKELASLMVNIAKMAGIKVVALLSDMNQPLGYAVGNALELIEAINTLKGDGPPDFVEHCLQVASQMLVLGDITADEDNAKSLVHKKLVDGSGWENFIKLVEAQGGDKSYLYNPERLPSARYVESVPSPRSGYLECIHARKVGETAVYLGAGRIKKGDAIDYGVGVMVNKKVGDAVEIHQPIFSIHANDIKKLPTARELLLESLSWSDTPVEPLPHFYGVVK